MPDECLYDVFISYARGDGREFAERLEQDLQTAGYIPWRDTRNIDPYQDFSAEIEMAIRASRFVVTCITPSVETSERSFVRREILYADAKSKPIIPLIFPNATPITPIIHLTWIPFYTGQPPKLDYESGLANLLVRLRAGPQPEEQYETDDPYRDYLRGLYDQIVYFLDRTVFSLIALRGESTPDAVRSEARRVLSMAFFDMAGVDLPLEERVTFNSFHAAYEKYGGSILLLGDPGAGKTTTLFAFARDWIVRRFEDPTLPLPLIAPIATWDAQDQMPLIPWLSGAIPALGREVITQLIYEGRALLLLDGLDELGGEREDVHTKEIYDPRKKFMDILLSSPHFSEKGTVTREAAKSGNGNKIVITCRAKDYGQFGQKIALRGAVTLQPLDDAQIREYLAELPDLLSVLETDPVLRDVARTPLLLSLFTFAYREQGAEAVKLSRLSNPSSDLRDTIFAQYVKRRYEHEERKLHAQLPFTLDRIRRVLGKTAIDNLGTFRRENVVYFDDFLKALKENREQTESFVDLVVRLHYIAINEEGTYRFIHLLLRDHLAFEPLIDFLHSRITGVRYNAAGALGKLSDIRAVEPLIGVLQDQDADVRRRAVESLGTLGGIRSATAIIAKLIDPDQYVRARAHAALGKIGHPAVEPLIVALHDQGGNLDAEAMGVLIQIGAVESLLVALVDRDWRLRVRAAIALGKLGDPRATEPLIDALRDRDSSVRARSAFALGEIGDLRANESLISALHDKSGDVRANAAIALGKLGGISVVEPLIVALRDKEPDVRIHIVQALVQVGEIAVRPLIATMTRGLNLDIIANVATTLGRLGDVRAVEPLIRELRRSPFIRENVVTALGELRDPRAIEPLIITLCDANWSVRTSATRALKLIGDPVIEPLIAALRNPDRDIRAQSALALGDLGNSHAVGPLIAALRDKISSVRINAVHALGMLGDARAAEALCFALNDSDQWVRDKAVDALVKIGGPSVKSLIVTLHDKDKSVCSYAANALNRIGTPEALVAVAEWRKERQ